MKVGDLIKFDFPGPGPKYPRPGLQYIGQVLYVDFSLDIGNTFILGIPKNLYFGWSLQESNWINICKAKIPVGTHFQFNGWNCLVSTFEK